MITQTHRLDVVPGGVTAVVHVKQYQTGESLVFELFSRFGDFAISAAYTECTVRGTKSDGNGYSANATCDPSNNSVTVELTEQMTAVPGRQPYEITITESTGRMITTTFILDVHRAALDADTVESESVIREVQTIVEDYLDAGEADDTIAEAIDAWLNEHPEATTTVQDGSISVPKLAPDVMAKLDEINSSLKLNEDDHALPELEYYRYLDTDIWVWHGTYSEIRFTYNSPSIAPKDLANADTFNAVSNAGLPGFVMVGGEVKNPNYSTYRGWGYLCIDSSYGFHTIKGQQTVSALESSGYMDACACFPPVVVNGSVYDYTEFSDFDAYSDLIDVNPRTMVGKKGNELYIIYVAGRMYESVGLSYDGCDTFASEVLGLDECYQLDGGGSSMLCVGSEPVGIGSEMNSINGRSIISCMTVK